MSPVDFLYAATIYVVRSEFRLKILNRDRGRLLIGEAMPINIALIERKNNQFLHGVPKKSDTTEIILLFLSTGFHAPGD